LRAMGARDYPDITREDSHVDATCMWMTKNPEWFDALVTGNLFGDIITDLTGDQMGYSTTAVGNLVATKARGDPGKAAFPSPSA
jgi:3-isopropylmalate dehydrogenase